MDRQANAMSGRSGSFVYNAVFAAKPDKTGWNHKGLKPDEEPYQPASGCSVSSFFVFRQFVQIGRASCRERV